MTVVYCYHPATGEFIGVTSADESPLEPGVFLLPANATFDAPPATPANEKAVFLAGVWSKTQDYRGTSYWLNGVETTIESLGVGPPIGSTPNKPAPTLAELKSALIAGVDAKISDIYSRFTRFETEYIQREAAARAFKAAGYTGDAGLWVTAFATNAGLTSHVAADIIIQQADQLRGALEMLAAQRMRKYGITAASDVAAAQALHDDIIAQASLIAAGL